jgi:hypothetical protein
LLEKIVLTQYRAAYKPKLLDHAFDRLGLIPFQVRALTQVALCLARFLCQNVILPHLSALYVAAGTDAESLLRTAAASHFRHLLSPSNFYRINN